MKKIHKIINNLFYMTKLSFKFSPIQYFIAIIDLVLNSVAPFVDLLFPKWILDEMTEKKRWEKVLFYISALDGSLTVALIIFKRRNGYCLPHIITNVTSKKHRCGEE